MSGMPRTLPLFVQRDRSRHGRIRFYFRREKGPRIRLPDDLQSLAFQEAYDAALRGDPVPPPKTERIASDSLQWLVDRYRESGEWASLSMATRKQRELIFIEAIKRSKNPRYGDITRTVVQRAVDARAKTPAQANNFLKAMRGLFRWAVRNEHVESDPTADAQRIRYRSEGFKAWTLEDAERFCERWPVGTKPRLAFELYLVSGIRRGDMHKAGPQHVRGSVLSMRTSKKGVPISVTLSQRTLAAIAATQTGHMAFMVKDNGEPFRSKESFGNWFSARCREAGLETGKSAHGIRKLAATMAAEAGGSTHELMAHFGWSTPSQAEIYTRGADRARLGAQSSARLAEEIENKSPRTLEPGAGIRTEKQAKSGR